MSGLSSEELDLTASSQQPLAATSDSRLLDAAETLVTLHSRGAGSRSRAAAQDSSKSKTVYLTQHQQPYKMAPQPPTSVSPSNMGPPPPPGPSSNNVTFLLINQNNPTNLMKPPMDPPPRRGRGRGRGRGSSVASGESGRGRGRGRGRGAHKPPPPPPVKWSEEMEASQDDVEMNEVGEVKEIVKEDTTFMVGNLELKDTIFDDILNKKKLELLMDPEIVSVLNRQQKTLRNGHRK